jgi:hypothetical protein
MVISQGTLVLASETITSGGTTSAGFSTGGSSLCGIQMPATFTGTHVTFLAATTLGGTYQPIYNSSGQVKYPASQGQYVAIDPKDFYGVFFLQIQSDATEAATRTLICSMKGI